MSRLGGGQDPVGTAPRPGDRGVASAAVRFEERAALARRRPWRQVLWAVLLLAVAAALAWLLWWSPVLSMRTVEVSGVTGPEAKAVAALVRVPTGTPLARVDTGAVAARVRTRISVAEVSVERSWPGTLVVRVEPRTPVVVVKNPEGQLEVVDRSGVVYRVVTRAPDGIPVVTAASDAAMTRAAVGAAIAVVEALPADLSARVSRVTVSSADLVTFHLGGVTVVWGGAGEGQRKVAIISALLRTHPQLIDVSAPDTPVTR